MPHRKCRKTSAILLCWVMMTLFWCQGMVYPVNGGLGINTFEIVDLQVLDGSNEDIVTIAEDEVSEAQISIDEKVSPQFEAKVENTVVEDSAPPQGEVDTLTENHAFVVQRGDTLSGVANRYQTTVGEIMKLNSIDEPNSIFVGQKLWIPSRGDAKAYIVSEPSRGRIQVSKEELELLARVIHAEARGEDLEGQIAVGAVVLNRVADHRFPSTIHDVVYQRGAFTAVIDKQIHLTPNQNAYWAAEAALNGEDPTDGAIYYYNPRIATDRWIKTRPVVKTIGNHTFSI